MRSGLGASLASGNSSSKSVNVTADAVKATAADKWTLYGRLLYGEDDDQTTADQVSAGVRYDRNISPSAGSTSAFSTGCGTGPPTSSSAGR